MADLSDNDMRVEMNRCVESLQRIDMEVFIIDTTHHDLKIPALYTIVPGAHFRERSMIKSVGLFVAKLLLERVHDQEIQKEKLAEMQKLLPNTYYLEFYRGRILCDSGAYEEAIVHFDRALEIGPEEEDLPYIYSYKGSCLKDLGLFDQAIKVLEQGLAEDSERPDLYNLIGVCYFKKDEYQKAISHFERAVHLNPASATDYANLGVNYFKLNKNEEAKQFLTLALTLDPALQFAREYLDKISACKN
jgi:ribosomal protein S12 methylthiotransferase accessory factor